jgi:CheY-like chemotaxis protein
MVMDAADARLDGVAATRRIRQAGDLPRVLMLTHVRTWTSTLSAALKRAPAASC